jgi:glyoxylase-like metal-dependent hydrolase (beta-lactamase superfamily II)
MILVYKLTLLVICVEFNCSTFWKSELHGWQLNGKKDLRRIIMSMTQHGDYLTKLTRMRFVNYYLVQEEDGLTLIDSGLGGGARGILEAAEKLGSPIRRITLTHAHGDHAGSLDELVEQLPGVEVHLSERTQKFLAGDLSLLPGEPQASLRGGFIRASTQATYLVAAGDQVGSLQVVAAPGHTPDQIAFWDTRDGTLIAGDAFQTLGGLAVSGQIRWLFPLPALATWHKPTALESARNLMALNPNRLAVGHGAILDNPISGMETVIQEGERSG